MKQAWLLDLSESSMEFQTLKSKHSSIPWSFIMIFDYTDLKAESEKRGLRNSPIEIELYKKSQQKRAEFMR